MMEVEIRSTHAADAAVLSRIAQVAKRHWGYSEEHMRLWEEDLTVTAEFIGENVVHCAVKQCTIVGFYALSKRESTYELEHMWVLPEHMGEGIGSRLFDHALHVVRSEGGTRLNIASDPYAEGFYRKKGAVRIGEVPSRPEGRTLPLLALDFWQP